MINTHDYWQLAIVFEDAERKAFWMNAIGTDTVPIKSNTTHQANLPRLLDQDVYMLDQKACNFTMIERIIDALHAKFHPINGVSREDVVHDVRVLGIPIQAKGVRVVTGDEAQAGNPLAKHIAN